MKHYLATDEPVVSIEPIKRAEPATDARSGEADTCECGHSADTHDPCCVSPCGCDGFEPRKPTIEEVFKAAMREIKELAQDALGYDQICDPIQAVRRLAQEFAAVKAQLAEAQDLRQDANAAFEAMRKAGLMTGTRPVTLSNLTAKAIERTEQAKAQLADAEREVEHSHEIIIGQNEEIVKAKARLAQANTKAEGWQNRCQEVMAKLDGQSYLFMKLELEKAEADAARLRVALEQIRRWTRFYMPLANGSSWEETLREVSAFAESALTPESTAPAEEVKE